MTKTTLSIDSEFVVLNPDKQASVEVSDSSLYLRLNEHYNGFTGHQLVSCYEFSTDWPTWEMHPYGDEIVVLLSGQTEFILQTDDTEVSIILSRQGEYVLVPRSVWHTARTLNRCKLLFITPGEGTEHRPV